MGALSNIDLAAKLVAKAAGLHVYMPQKPCRYGHVSVRGVVHGKCVQCKTEAAKRWLNENGDRRRAWDAAYARRKRREKAAVEGREVVVGRIRVLTDQQRRERARLSSLRYWAERPGLHATHGAAYHAANPGKTQARVRKRRAIKLNAPGSHTAADIALLREKQRGKCILCLEPFGNATPHVDHYVPLALGGSNDPQNLRLLHATCNLSKGAKHPLDHGISRGLLCW